MKEQKIESFGNQGTADIFAGRNTREARKVLPRELHTKARTVLEALDKTEELLSLKQFNIKQLSGERSDQYSLRINRQYRVCFEWDDGTARFVQILDYH